MPGLERGEDDAPGQRELKVLRQRHAFERHGRTKSEVSGRQIEGDLAPP